MKGAFGSRFGSLLKLVELLFYPSACRLCLGLLENAGEKVVCETCLSRIGPELGPFCQSCGRFFSGEGEKHLCSSCTAAAPPYRIHRSWGRYEGELKDLILIFKYQKVRVLGKILAGCVDETPASTGDLWAGLDYVVPVPLDGKRKRERGFNQSLVFARHLAGTKKVPILGNCLVKIRSVAPQTSLDAEDRRLNVRGAYGIRRGSRVDGKTLLLVDDVFTTGATIGECSRVLLKAGASEVRATTLARA